jgi:hypothetical protein
MFAYRGFTLISYLLRKGSEGNILPGENKSFWWFKYFTEGLLNKGVDVDIVFRQHPNSLHPHLAMHRGCGCEGVSVDVSGGE